MASKIRLIRAWLGALYVHYFLHSDPKAKCPACGYRLKHKVEFIPQQRQILHLCTYCQAEWMENPMMPAESWMAAPARLTQDKPAPEQQRTAQREPIYRGKGQSFYD